MRRLGPVRRALLRRVYRLIDLFAGTPDTLKHLIVLFNYGVRTDVAAGRNAKGRRG